METHERSDSIEEQVLTLVAELSGAGRNKLSLQSRLNYEIGMDGDDASEFFGVFRAHFTVDLELLYENWDLHFSPEGMSLQSALSWMIPPTLTALVLDTAFHYGPTWLCFAGTWILWIGTVVLWSRLRRSSADSPAPIFIIDLVEAAQARQWKKLYPIGRHAPRNYQKFPLSRG